MGNVFKAALVQNEASGDMTETLKRASDLTRDARAQSADLIILPEYFSCYSVDKSGLETGPHAENDHPALAAFSELAAELACWIVLGSIAVPAPDGRSYNRQYVLDDTGSIRARYEKIHLFDVDLSGNEVYRESNSLSPGARAVVTPTPWGNLGMSICYDVRFPHLYRDLAKAGADFLTVPAAFTHKTGSAHWHVLLRARAIETGCFVFGNCQSGYHGKARTYGHSLIVNPWGEVIAEGPEETEAIVIADIDPAEIAEARQRIPALTHDRPYTPPSAQSHDTAAE